MMKQHEKDAQLAALRKQIEELEAMPVEPEQPLCVIPERLEEGAQYFVLGELGNARKTREEGSQSSCHRFNFGNYFSSERQAAADAHAVSVMRLMRRQPGVVGADSPGKKWRPIVDRGLVWAECINMAVTYSNCMFPCYATEAQARDAIEAVGGEDALRRCAEYWSGVMK